MRRHPAARRPARQPEPGRGPEPVNPTAASRLLPRPAVTGGTLQLARDADARGMGNRAVLGELARVGVSVTEPSDVVEREAGTIATAVRGPATTPQPAGDARPTARVAGLPEVLASAMTSGTPLAPGIRARVEPVLGADLTGVRVHTGPAAAEAAASVGARAFTIGSDVVLGAGESATNAELLAHEATHVVQQSGGTTKLARAPEVRPRPTAADRRRRDRATRLNAADARTVVGQTLPFVLARMSGGQLAQLQKVMDAAVVNPAVQAEAAAIDKKAIIAQSGNLVNRDPDLVEKAERLRERNLVGVSESDKRVQLDATALLSSDALTPRSDNPDEAAYLEQVASALATRGVWLRINQPWVKSPDDPGSWHPDPRVWECWLSLGPTGDTIPTRDGSLTREAVLGTSAVGAGYYRNVHQGPVATAMHNELNRLRREQDAGWAEHLYWLKARHAAGWFVTRTSDLLGGADFPDFDIWDGPHKLHLRAWDAWNSGSVAGAQAFLVLAAIATRNACQLVADFVEDTTNGAMRAVKILTVAKRAGQVAEVGLTLVGAGAVLRGGRAAGAAAATEVDVAAGQFLKEYSKKAGLAAEEISSVRYVRQPKGSIGGGVKGGHSSGNQGLGMGKHL